MQQICKTSGLPTKGNKHELVKSLAVRNEENEPSRFQPHYDGDIKSLPSNMSDIKKLPIATLKYILKSHSISICGNKDELMLRVFLLKHGRPYLAAFNQVKAVKNTIQIAKAIISEEVKTYFLETDNVRRVRKHSVMLKNRSSLPVPEWIKCPSDLHNIFEPLERYINNGIDKSNTACLSVPLSVENCVNFNDAEDESTYDAYFEIGTRIRVRWTKDEIGDSGWRSGWYVAEVQGSNILEDTVEVVYISEPKSIYTIEVTEFLGQGKLQLI